MAAPSLQDGINEKGSPINLLWKPNTPNHKVPVVEPEYAGWREEQRAWREGVVLMNLSHHMWDTWIEGPDATKLLMDVSANNYEKFVIGQAKQFVPVTEEGLLITDGILFREEENKYCLTGVPASQTWVRYHGEKGNYDVNFKVDPDSGFRGEGKDPVLFRYQIQGPKAMEVVERAFGAPIPETKFFHSTPVELDGVKMYAFRHGMAGQPGYEFIGPYEGAEKIMDAFLKAGEPSGLVRVGGLAYWTNGIESGWIPTPTPAIYTAPELEDYRKFVPLFSYEGQRALQGTCYSENIEDYYVSPYELGYGRSISFNHDFIGKEALQKRKEEVTRTKVTVVLDADDVKKHFGEDPGYILDWKRYRIETEDGKCVGMTFYNGYIDPLGTILCLSLVENEAATPGTPVTVVWGDGDGSEAAEADFKHIKGQIQPSPYDDFARTQYRKD